MIPTRRGTGEGLASTSSSSLLPNVKTCRRTVQCSACAALRSAGRVNGRSASSQARRHCRLAFSASFSLCEFTYFTVTVGDTRPVMFRPSVVGHNSKKRIVVRSCIVMILAVWKVAHCEERSVAAALLIE